MYPNEKVWGVDLGEDRILAVDPMTNEAFEFDVPTRGGFNTPWCLQPGFCTLNAYINPANPHNPMLDSNGLLWITTQIRSEAAADRPDFCLEKDPSFIFAGHRQVGYFDTNTEEFALINTCFGTHHLQFDNDGLLWLSGDSAYIGWVDPSMIDSDNCGVESCPSEADAQDWSQVLVDPDGEGDCDFPVFGFHYGIIPNSTDGSVWTGVLAGFPGNIQRFDPSTGCHELYEPPPPGFGPRGIDVDTDGNVWTCLGGSSHVAKFDRGECDHTYGTGDQCPEGWHLWEIPGPHFQNCLGYNEAGGGCQSDFHYYAWVDQFNTFGLGEDVVFCNGTGSDSLIAFNPQTEEFTRIRVPYPLNFYQRGLDGRIDDPDAGWKGRGIWVDNGGDPIEHAETEIGQVCHVQLRPDPLAH
jgi:streptogramin lyase